jgi:hypothetical protein
MGMTGGFRKKVITYHDGKYSSPRKSTPLYALGPLVSEKVIGREITNFRNRRLDQTPSDGASVVNRTLCNDDRTTHRTIDVSISNEISEEAVSSVSKRSFQSYEWENKLTTTLSIEKTSGTGSPFNGKLTVAGMLGESGKDE